MPVITNRKNGSKGKLLVVDDDEALRRLMHLELSGTYEVIDTGEPEQGLALALEHKPNAILLDLRMPKYSGYELLQTFTTFSHTQKIPVIIVSGEAGGQTKEHCKQLGAAGYFEKPIDFEAVDERPVDLILVLLTPEGAGADHLKALARVSRLFRDRAMCEKLRGTDNVDALTALLTDRAASHAA